MKYAALKLFGALALAACAAIPAQAQVAGYPERPIELVVPWAAGGGTDSMARSFAEAAKKHMAQPFIVNNKPGATGSIGFSDVARAAPDGYKVSVLTAEILIIPHMGIGKVSQDDFIPVARFNALASAISVKADAPWNTVEEFLAAAKRMPGSIKVGNSGVGSIWHLAAAAVGETGPTGCTAGFRPGILIGLTLPGAGGGTVVAPARSPARSGTTFRAGPKFCGRAAPSPGPGIGDQVSGMVGPAMNGAPGAGALMSV